MSFKLFVFLLATILGVIFSLPSLLNIDGRKIHLGLDLQGGTYMLLSTNPDEAVANKLLTIQSDLNRFCEKNEISLSNNSIIDHEIHISISDIDDAAILFKRVKEISYIDNTFSNNEFILSFTEAQIKDIKSTSLQQSLDIIRNRLEQFGLSEPSITPIGTDRIAVELAGIDTVSEEDRIKKLITARGNLKFMAVNDVLTISSKNIIDDKLELLPDAKNPNIQYAVNKISILDGSAVIDANVLFDENNKIVINFELSGEGSEIFSDFTENNIGRRLGIILDGKVNSAPVINTKISGGRGQITGDFTMTEANDLAIALRSGSMVSSLTILEKKTIGASLASDSIKSGVLSIVFGFISVMLFMAWFYRLSGLVANIALISNIFLIFGALSILGATLTLPGLAGIVLTIGMAVDANVILSEKMKEELRAGNVFSKALSNTYQTGIKAIVDSNITTLIATTFLYTYGSAPLKGFAITLSIGVISSMLTSIVGTHGIYLLFSKRISRFKHINIIGLRKHK